MAERVVRKFKNIIDLPESKLQTALASSINTNYIFTSFASDEDIVALGLLQDQGIVLRPDAFPPVPGDQAGGGTATMDINGTLIVSIWSRLWVDQAGRDVSWLRHSTLGVSTLIDGVIAALEQYDPLIAGDYALVEPMRLLAPGFKFPMKRVGEWGKVEATYSFHWWEDCS